jgi:hypothetical protein
MVFWNIFAPHSENRMKPIIRLLRVVSPDSFSREAWVKTNQKNAVQHGGPIVFVRFSAGFGRDTRYTAKLTAVVKCILQPSDVA